MTRVRLSDRRLRIIATTMAFVGTVAAQAQVDGGRFRPMRDRSVRAVVDLPSHEVLQSIDVSPELAAKIHALGADDFAQREHTMLELQHDTTSAYELLAALATLELDTEQRYRLLEILDLKLRSIPRGALGIRMITFLPMPDQKPGVIVSDTLPGFPAAEVLERYDRITHIDGDRIGDTDMLVRLVQLRRPGEPVTLTVDRIQRDEHGNLRRDESNFVIYDTIDVELKLGSAEELEETSEDVFESPIVQERRQQSRIATQRYGPKPVQLEIDASRTSHLHEEREEAITLQLVNEHEYIKQAKQEIELIEQGLAQVTPELRRRWTEQLLELMARSNRPDYTDVERQRLRRFAEDFRRRVQPYIAPKPHAPSPED